MNEIAPGVVVFNNIFNDSMRYIEQLSKKDDLWTLATIGENNNKHQSYNKKHRDTDALTLKDRLDLDHSEIGVFSKMFYEQTGPSVFEYIKNYDVSFSNFEKAQLLRYGIGQKFDMHIDDHPQAPRTVSLVYYANSDYVGGEIEFPRFNIKIKPESNQLLIFPSNFMYAHTVHQVVDGTRFCVVQWIS